MNKVEYKKNGHITIKNCINITLVKKNSGDRDLYKVIFILNLSISSLRHAVVYPSQKWAPSEGMCFNGLGVINTHCTIIVPIFY